MGGAAAVLAVDRRGDPPAGRVERPEVQALGLLLYFDEGLSSPTEGASPVSCDSCHHWTGGGADPGRAFSDKADGSLTPRNSLSLADVGARPRWGWTGKFETLEAMIRFPLVEASVYNHVDDPGAIEAYVEEFHHDAWEAAFGDIPVTLGSGEPGEPSILGALAALLRRPELSSPPSALDELIDGGDPAATGALTAEQIEGAKLFVGEAACVRCHQGPWFTDDEHHNDGVPDENPDAKSALEDLGSDDPLLAGAFLTPPLRGVADTTPYFHNGAVDELWEVVDHYARGGGAPGEFAGTSEVVVLNLEQGQRDALAAFLTSLIGPEREPLEALEACRTAEDIAACVGDLGW